MSIKRRYSMLEAIRSQLEKGDIHGGFERELSQEMRKRNREPERTDHGGIILPSAEVLRDAGCITEEQYHTRTINATTGAALISTDLLVAEFVPGLVAKTVLNRAGATHLDNLVGNIAIPKGGSVDAAWIATDGGDAVADTPSMSQVTATPHTVGGYIDLTRKFVMQTSIAADRLCTMLLQDAVSRAIDKAGFDGSGLSGEPTGLANIQGVTSVSGITPGAPTKANLVDFWKALETANVGADAARWIMSPSVYGDLSQRLDIHPVKNVAGTENVGGVSSGKYLVQDGKCEGYPVLKSNLSGAKLAWFGNWCDLLICTWGAGTEILVDKYTLSKSGGTRIVAMQAVDIACRYPQAFAKGQLLA